MVHSQSARSVRGVVCQLAAGMTLALACPAAANAQHAPLVKIVSDAACPLVLESAAMTTSPAGVSITYLIRNREKDAAKEIVITAAAVNLLGEVVSLRMQPVVRKIAGGSAQQFTIVFPDLDVVNAEAVSVGVQGVRWSGMRREWRTALRVSGPTVLAAKK